MLKSTATSFEKSVIGGKHIFWQALTDIMVRCDLSCCQLLFLGLKQSLINL